MATCKIYGGDVSVVSDLIKVGSCPEEGTPIIGEVFYAVITLSDGSRFRHEHNFYSIVFVLDNEHEFGGWFRRDETAEKKAKTLAFNVETAGEFTIGRWSSIRPAYGSEAYCEGGWSEEDARAERQFDMEGY